MRRPLLASGWVTAAGAAALALLLVGLAAMQYHWTSELALASEARARDALSQAAQAFAEDFDHELLRMMFQFRDLSREEVAGELPRRVAAWRGQALYPDLLRAAFVIHRQRGEAPALQQLDEHGGVLRAVEWPEELRPLRESLAALGAPIPPHASLPKWPGPMAAGVPAWLVPLRGHDDEPPWMHDNGPPDDFALLWVDTGALRRELLPALTERHFGGGYRVEVRDQHGELVFARGTVVAPGRPDLTVPLFRLAMVERFHRRIPFGGDLRGGEARMSEGGGDPPAGDPHAPMPGMARGPLPTDGLWTLAVTHPAGSLAAAVARVRRHNLLMSLSALALLAAAVALVLVSARRAQALAQKQIELVAGVSHELLTPVAALRSAGENLAAGVISDPEKVRAYGELVEREGRRLGALVEQVLTWAGLQVRGEPAMRQAVDVADVVETVSRGCAGEARRAGVRIEEQVTPATPAVLGDRAALERALRNLVENALRHGGDGGWVGVGAAPRDGGVALWVEDHGRGIDLDELHHLFEPFHRGRRSLDAGVPGSGLGLALARQIVEAHGGRVRVTPVTPQGVRFTFELPGGESG